MVLTERHLIKLPEEYASLMPAASEDSVFAFQPPITATQPVAVWLVVLDKTCIVWLGNASAAPALDSLIVAMHSKSMGDMHSTLLAKQLSDAWDTAGEATASRLAKRFGIQVFWSDQLSAGYHQPPLCHFIERSVSDLLARHFPSTAAAATGATGATTGETEEAVEEQMKAEPTVHDR